MAFSFSQSIGYSYHKSAKACQKYFSTWLFCLWHLQPKTGI